MKNIREMSFRYTDRSMLVVLIEPSVLQDVVDNAVRNKGDSLNDHIIRHLSNLVIEEYPELSEMMAFHLAWYNVGDYNMSEPNYVGICIHHHGLSRYGRQYTTIYLGKKEHDKILWCEDYTPMYPVNS